MTAQASGRSPEVRRRILLAGVLLSALLATGRAFQLGVLEGEAWRTAALNQQGDTLPLPAPRGTIFDRDGVPLAASHDVYRVAIAPREIADRARVTRLLREHLRLTTAEAERVTNTQRRWVVLQGRFGAEVREALDNVSGVHFESVQQRFYPHGEVARELLGPVNLEGRALGGIELEFDSVLRGRAGRAVLRRDSRGRPLPGAMLRAVEPVPGRDVYLSIDYDLQEIADEALRDALERTQARGGEMLLTDPATGEVLAAVSRTSGSRARNWRAVTDPYEPGSTLKPFTVAALLAQHRAALGDSVFGENGRYERLRLTDVHAQGWMTLGEALRESSNIGIAKAAERLEPAEQYVALRDFGFGSPTGVTYPSEAGGRLRRPQVWTFTSASRLAIGYEIAVTPLQMAMAYGALANGGMLLEPRLVREVRSRDGRVERSLAPRMVRRVIPENVATQLRDVLVDAVAQGTGRAAALGPFDVAGKTGTAWLTENGRYKPGAYIASFAGFFPARDPQLVFIVKLEEPRGEYYGGRAAAPVTRATLEAALATRSTPIDRALLAASAPLIEEPVRTRVLTRAPATPSRSVEFVSDRAIHAAPPPAAPRTLPDVTGRPLRDAVRELHRLGVRVRVEGGGRVRATVPDAGAAVAPNSVVRVLGERSA